MASTLSGCASFDPADPERGRQTLAAPPRIDWPSRYPGPLVEIAGKPLSVEEIAHLPYQEFVEHLWVGKRPEAIPKNLNWNTVFRGVFAEGTVCEEEPREPEDGGGHGSPGLQFRFVTNWYPPEQLDAARREIGKSPGILKFLFNEMSFALHEPEERPARGIVFCISSWGGQQRELAVRDGLLGRGWAVIVSSPPVKSREHLEISVSDREDLPRAALEAAREIDNRIADGAYGIESALAFLRQARPGLPESPVFVIGYSAGATVAPAVAARLGRRISGLVLVGAGANLARAGLTSTFEGQPLRLRWTGGSPDETDIERFCKLYLDASRLDPHWTAAHCEGMPVLLLQARWDRVVPAGGAEALHERLGRPDRYRLPFGHTWLFWMLPAYRDVIADWLERAAALATTAERVP